jgi:undecaprenyl-diphosphatase
VTHLGSNIAVIFFVLLTWVLTGKRTVIEGLALLYGIELAVVYGLKYIVRRKRPPFSRETASRLSDGPGEILDPSFPSAHTAYAFMMATLLSSFFPCYRVLFYAAAGLIGWTRLYLGIHFPTDVAGGAVLGYGVTKIFLITTEMRFFGNQT